jgi:hypothetical protein
MQKALPDFFRFLIRVLTLFGNVISKEIYSTTKEGKLIRIMITPSRYLPQFIVTTTTIKDNLTENDNHEGAK